MDNDRIDLPPDPVSEGPSASARVLGSSAEATGPRRPSSGRGPRPDLAGSREPVTRESSGYTLRLDPPDLARLRELPGAKGKTDRELGEQFLETHAARLTAAVAGDVESPAELRVVVDPYSRQAFLALQNRIRGITSF